MARLTDFPRTPQPKPPTPADRLEPEHQEAFRTWQADPSPEASGQLLKTLAPAIDHAATAHVGPLTPNLRSKARQLSLQALRDYDPQRASLRTHLYNRLTDLRRYARQQQNVLGLPERLVMLQGSLAEHTDAFRTDEGRDPTDEELADRLQISPKMIRRARKFKPGLPESFVTGGVDDAGEETDASPAVQAQKHSKYWTEVVYEDLAPIDRLILEHSLGLHDKEPLPNHAIAQVVGMSPSAVSQRKLAIQQKLDQLSLNPFS